MDFPIGTLLSREILGNVATPARIAFYLLASLALAIMARGIVRRVQKWRLGKPAQKPLRLSDVVGNLLRLVIMQRRIADGSAASLAHRLLTGGFLVLFVGTVLVAVEHVAASLLGRSPGDPVFHKGVYFAIFELVLDAAGLVMLAGCGYFLIRRVNRPARLDHTPRDWLVLGLLAGIGTSGYIVEALRIIREQTPMPGFSFVGFLVACGFEIAGLTPVSATTWHVIIWWLHAAASLGLIALFPYCRLLHTIAGAVRLAAGVEPLGVLSPVSIAEVEETGELGVGHFEQFAQRQLVELDACVACGRCDAVCPAFEAGKPLAPRSVVQNLRREFDAIGSQTAGEPRMLAGDVIAEETLWACTTCSACVAVCPLGVNPLGLITDLRRRLVSDARLRGAPATALQKMGRSGNPWGLPAAERLAFARDLVVPTVAENPAFEVLYWVGCAAAYDRRLQNVARCVVRLLLEAKVNFAVLGPKERCTGEVARRMGDELLFQQLAAENMATFDQHGVRKGSRKILSHCPHCVNSFLNDYPQLGADLEVVHHTQFLTELVETGRLSVPAARHDVPGQSLSVTYHDPCYLARVAGQTEAPRKLLSVASQELHEMPRHGEKTACCGAGGGRMWFDDTAATRTGRGRIDEALSTGGTTLAVSCPFCLTMTADGLAARGGGMTVRDVAEILANAIFQDTPTPAS